MKSRVKYIIPVLLSLFGCSSATSSNNSENTRNMVGTVASFDQSSLTSQANPSVSSSPDCSDVTKVIATDINDGSVITADSLSGCAVPMTLIVGHYYVITFVNSADEFVATLVSPIGSIFPIPGGSENINLGTITVTDGKATFTGNYLCYLDSDEDGISDCEDTTPCGEKACTDFYSCSQFGFNDSDQNSICDEWQDKVPALNSVISPPDSWKIISNTGGGSVPIARTTEGFAVVRGKLCLWGGQIIGNSITDTGACYDPAADTWTTMTNVGAPSLRYAHSAVSINGLFCVWGGSPAGSNQVVNTGACYNPVNDTWIPISNTGGGSIPEARMHHAALNVQGHMCIWGGMNALLNNNTNSYLDNSINTGGCYDPKTDSWISISNTGGGLIPSDRAEPSAINTNNKMCIFGGYSYSSSEWPQTGGCYNPSNDSWTTISNTGGGTLPESRYAHAAGNINGKMCIWGGMNHQQEFLGDGGCYDLVNDKWTSISNINSLSPRMYVENGINISTNIIGRLCIWGGAGADNARFNDGACYLPSSDSWTSISNTGGGSIPSGRNKPVVGVIDHQMIIWGGIDANGQLDSGGIWNPNF